MGEDYVSLQQTVLTLTVEEREQCVNITIINDDEVSEPSEEFFISLELISGDANVLNALATATILDDDCK